jgi:hypothetical protein
MHRVMDTLQHVPECVLLHVDCMGDNTVQQHARHSCAKLLTCASNTGQLRWYSHKHATLQTLSVTIVSDSICTEPQLCRA